MMTTTREILGLVLPTNEPATAKRFIFSDTSLRNLEPIRKISTFLLNFQEPWNQCDIKALLRRLDDKGFSYRFNFNEYKIKGPGLVPVNRIRYDTAKLMPEALFYALIDDDMEFVGPSPKMKKCGGQQYLDAVHFMTKYPECGLVLVGGSMYKFVPTYHIGICPIDSAFLTSKGFIFKAMTKPGNEFLPVECIDLLGSDEEKVIAAHVMSHGLFPAKMRMGRINHYENHRKGIEAGKECGWNTSDIVDQNNGKFIRENYNPDFKGNGHYNVIDPGKYILAGGKLVDKYDHALIARFTKNYEDIDTLQELLDIMEYATQIRSKI